jgi:hypothetical protein
VTTFAELDAPTVVVTPGAEATTRLLVRNDSEIVEAYGFEVLGDCAPWTTVEPPELRLYPGTSEAVTVRLRPPRSPEVAAGETPMGLRVLPRERPGTGTVSETTVRIEPFWELAAELAPRRRLAWRSARYRVRLHNYGNTDTEVGLRSAEGDERLRFALGRTPTPVPRGTTAEAAVRARVRTLVWTGKQVSYPFQLTAQPRADGVPAELLDGELVQVPLLPRWLLALLAALLALLLAWFALVRPTVRSTARQAIDDQTQRAAAASAASRPPAPAPPGVRPSTTASQPAGGGNSTDNSGGGPGGGAPGGGGQSSATIEVRVRGGDSAVGTYPVPAGKVLRITDIVVANPQGDEGLMTIVFGSRTITVIALETFRNQDYHWVTPIDVPARATVQVRVTCGRPGTPASGRQASTCLEVLNVNGVLVNAPR